MIKAIFFLSIISYWNVMGGPPPIISKISFTEEELFIDGTGLENTQSVSIRSFDKKLLKDYEVDNAIFDKIVAQPLDGSFKPGDKNLYLVITDSEGDLFYPIILSSKTSTKAIYKITQKKKDKIPNKIVVDEKSEINFSPSDDTGYYYNYSIYANQVGDLAIKNDDKNLFKLDHVGNLEIAGNLKVKGRTLKFKNPTSNTLNFENYLFPVLPTNQSDRILRISDVIIGEDNNISGVVNFTSLGSMDVATSTFHVESSTGRVGIGNATPTYKLDISGATNSGIRLRQAAASTNTSGGFFNGMVFEDPGQVKSFGIGYGAGDLFSINSYDGTNYRNIFSLNNVGNGVVSGSLKIGAYILPAADGASGTVLKTDGAGTVSWAPSGSSIPTDGGIANRILTSNGSNNPTWNNTLTNILYEDFSSTATNPTYKEGRLFYNSTNRTLSYYNQSATVTVDIGEELIFLARNNTGATIFDGTPVYITGATGNRPTIALAKADNAATSRVIGITTQDFNINGDGYVTMGGLVRGLNTSAFSEGAILYLSETTAGSYTTTPPPIAVIVGRVINSHNTQGVIGVSPAVAAGNIIGPPNSIDGRPAIFSGTSGKILANTVPYTIPTVNGTNGQVLTTNGAGSTSWTSVSGAGLGDVTGPASSTVNNLSSFSDGTGKVIKDSGINSTNLPTMGVVATAANQIIISAGPGKQFSTTLYPISETIGASGTVLKSNGSGASWQTEVSVANFTAGPASSTLFAIPRYQDTTGKILKDSPVVMDDAGNFNFLRTVSTTQGSHPCPSMNTAQRDALSASDGDCVFNTDLLEKHIYRMGRWAEIPIRDTWVSGNDYIVEDIIKYQHFNLSADRNFTAGATISDDYFNGNIHFTSVMPITTCTNNGGEVTLSGGNIDVIAGRGVIVSKSTDTAWPDEKRVTWNNTFSIPPDSTATWNTVYVDETGIPQVLLGKPTPLILRTKIVLAVVNPGLSQVEDHRGPCFDMGAALRDLNYVLGPLLKGFEYYGKANLTMGRNAGEIYSPGINFDSQNQSIQSFSAVPTISISYYMTRNARIGGLQTNVDPYNFDDDGTLTNIPQGSRFTYQRIYLVGGSTAVQYGQKWYNSITLATSGITADASQFVENPNLASNGKWIATIVMKDGTTDLTNPEHAAIINCGIFGCSQNGGGGASGGGGGGDVFGPSSSVANNLPIFSDITGKLIQDSGINKANLTTMTTGAVGANQIIISAGGKELSSTIYQIPPAIGTTGTVLKSDGTNAFWQADESGLGGDVVGPASASPTNLAAFDGTTGKLIEDSGISSANLVTMATAASANDKIIVSDGNNKSLKDSGITYIDLITRSSPFSAANRVPLTGGNNRTLSETAYTIPAADGIANQVLQTDGAGTLSWVNQAASDARLKKNIEPLEKNFLEEVLELDPVSFEWRKDKTEGRPEGIQRGLIAQEVQKIIPEAVYKNGEILVIDNYSLISTLIGAIKEQQKQIEELKKLIKKKYK